MNGISLIDLTMLPIRLRSDNDDMDEFETGLGGNFFKIWNGMSSGSYLPPPVEAMEIPGKS